MNQKTSKIDLGIGLDDSELASYIFSRKKNELVVEIQAWNLCKVNITFIEPLYFIDRGCQFVTEFCELMSDSPFLEEVLKNNFEQLPQNHCYRLFQLLDLDEKPALEIVCRDIAVTLHK
ncbi:MAG: hypothetical protein WAM28_01950 [Chlamydiales bacterium]